MRCKLEVSIWETGMQMVWTIYSDKCDPGCVIFLEYYAKIGWIFHNSTRIKTSPGVH